MICPCCKSSIRAPWVCNECFRRYPTVDGKPVLIDFVNSVFDERSLLASSGRSEIRRRRSAVAALRWLAGGNAAAPRLLSGLARQLPSGSKVLIVGGGALGHGISALFEHGDLLVVSFDVYLSELTHFAADAHSIPVQDETFDLVVVQAVLEHVLEPHVVVDEISRVLKFGGYVYAETPFLQQVHEGPYDFTRFTESGHRWLFRRFAVCEAGPLGGPASQILWSIYHLLLGLTRSRTLAKSVRTVLQPIRILDRLIPLKFRVDSALGFYLLGTKQHTNITMSEVIEFYRGAG